MPGGFYPPPSVVASWPTPNYVDPPDRGPGMLIVAVVFGVLMLAIASARLWVRFRIQREPGLDDYIMALAVLPAVGLVISLCILSPVQSWNRHIWDTPPDTLVPIQRLSWISQLLFHISTSLTKISVLVLYLRVIQGTANKIFLNIVRGAIGLLTAYMLSGIILVCLICKPLNAYWEQFHHTNPSTDHICWDQGILPMYSAVFNVFTDFLTTCLPMFLFVQLKLPFREKLSLAAVFGLGFIVCAAAVMRLYWNHAVFYRTYDITWIAYTVWIWTLIECLLGIICACLPPLRPLFKRFFRSTISGNSYPIHSFGWSKNITGSASDTHYNSYHLQTSIRGTTSTEWDKNSHSSSVPLDQSHRDDGTILRTYNIEVTYNPKEERI